MSSKEEKIFRKYLAELAGAIDSPVALANYFHSEGLIGQHTKHYITDVNNSRGKYQRASDLLDAVYKKVKYNPSLFPKVILVLGKHDDTKSLADDMAAKGNAVRKVHER